MKPINFPKVEIVFYDMDGEIGVEVFRHQVYILYEIDSLSKLRYFYKDMSGFLEEVTPYLIKKLDLVGVESEQELDNSLSILQERRSLFSRLEISDRYVTPDGVYIYAGTCETFFSLLKYMN